MNTLQLDADWDLAVANGTLVVASGGASIAQDVASEMRTFQGEVWYDWTRGVPYYQQVLGQPLNLQLLKQVLVVAGSKVPGVGLVVVYLTGPDAERSIGGQAQIYNTAGALIAVSQTTNLAGVAPWWVSAVSYDASGAST